eukprot:jgi/Mesvir1/21635/Mv04057-RA.1
MKTGLSGASPTFELSNVDKTTIDALICNLLSVACERAAVYVSHNADAVRNQHVACTLHAALLAETMTYMDRPLLEEEVAAVKILIERGDEMDEDTGSDGEEEESEGDEDGEHEDEDGDSESDEVQEEDESSEEEDKKEEGDECAEMTAHGIPEPTCKCQSCADMVTAFERWLQWDPTDPLLVYLKHNIPRIGESALLSIFEQSSDKSDEDNDETEEDDELVDN